jgi:transcriptional regulator GlxA family with amidase domain
MHVMDALEIALRRYLEDHGGRPIQQRELRTALGVGDRRLRRLFASVHGVSPTRFLLRLRLQLARERLERGADDRVTDVGMSCGFNDLGRFASSYRSVYHELPSETLRRHREPRGSLPD